METYAIELVLTKDEADALVAMVAKQLVDFNAKYVEQLRSHKNWTDGEWKEQMAGNRVANRILDALGDTPH